MRKNSHISFLTRVNKSSLTELSTSLMPALDSSLLLPMLTLIMPYSRDGYLGQFMKHLSDQQSVSALRQILLGLCHLHKRQIIHHADLKLENFLVDFDTPETNLTLIIADFGLSKIMVSSEDYAKTFCIILCYS